MNDNSRVSKMGTNKYRVVEWCEYTMDNTKRTRSKTPQDAKLITDAVIAALREHNYHFSGEYHQTGEYGAPVLNDGTIFCVSMRTWGSIMASAYPDEVDNRDGYGYCYWAWDDAYPDLVKTPDPSEFEI